MPPIDSNAVLDTAFFNEQGRFYCDAQEYDQALGSFEQGIKHATSTPADKAAAFEGAGVALRELRCFDEAEEMFQKAFDIAGSASCKLHVERGWLFQYQNISERALPEFSEALNIAVSDEDKHAARVGMLTTRQVLDAGRPILAEKNAITLINGWDEAGLAAEEIVSVFLDCSAILEKLNLYPAALNNCEQLLKFDNKIEKGWGYKISALKWLRRFAEAKRAYLDAVTYFPTSVELWNEMANIYYEQKHFKQAYRHYNGDAVDDYNIPEPLKTSLAAAIKSNEEALEWSIVSLRKMRELKEARLRIDKVLPTVSKKYIFLCEKASVFYAERNYDAAIEVFDRALVLKPYDLFALRWRVACFRRKQQFDKAQQDLDAALKKLPYQTALWEENGWLAFDQGNLEHALNCFDKATQLDPYLINRQFSKVEVLARLSRWDDALDVFRQLQQQFPEDAEVTEQLCWFYLRLDEPELAKEQLIKLRMHHPNDVLGINARGGYELAQRNYAEAENAFREAIAIVDHEPQYYINLAWALVRQVKSPGEVGRLEIAKRETLIDEAKDNCRKALNLDPYNSKAYGCLGVIAFKRNAFMDAEVYFRKSIELNPLEGSYVELAALYCQMGRFDQATTNLNKAMRLNENDARAYIEMGNVSVWKGDNKEAIRHCREAVVVEPKSVDAHRALVIALMRSDQYEEAETAVRSALAKLASTKPWQLYLLLSQILIHTGDVDNKDRKKKDKDLYEEAFKYVNEAKRCNPAHADIFFHAGIANHRLEDYRASQKSFADCVKLNRDRFEAERYSRIVQGVIGQQKELFKVNAWVGYILMLVCFLMLAGLWIQYFRGHQRARPMVNSASGAPPESKSEPTHEFTVDSSMLTVMTPILLGLLVVAALLPQLIKLKLPGGFEADIEPKQVESNISSGPRGDIGFGSSLPIINPEPR